MLETGLGESTDLGDNCHDTEAGHSQDRLANLAEYAAERADMNIAEKPTTSRSATEAQPPDFHGTSSVVAHASFAGRFIEDAMTVTTAQSAESDRQNMRVALDSLKRLLRMQRQHNVVSGTQLQHVQKLGLNGLAGLAMPPLSSVVAVLRELRERKTLTFTLICVFDSIDAFTDMCKQVYFATEEISTSVYISVCTGLYYLFQEKAALAVQEIQTHSGIPSNSSQGVEYRAHSMTCRDNLETAISSLTLLQTPKQETVEALIMAASYATEISKPSLAWQLNAAACQAVLAMGYHRKDLLPEETSEIMQRRRAVRFWFVYILDRALALRFGRSPNLPDYDITLPRQIGPLDASFQGHCITIQGWLHHAEAQGRAYETLYSPAALLKPVEERVRSARTCADILLSELQALEESRKQEASVSGFESGNQGGNCTISTMLLKADEVSIRSTLTLVYRAIPPNFSSGQIETSSTFCTECVECARNVMELHFECMEVLKQNQHLAPAYMHWTILFSPFIPFIVLFCHAIENCNRNDLVLVQQFKLSLFPFRHISEPVDRLYHLCDMLCDVAELYFKSNQAKSHHRIYQQQRQWFDTDAQGGHADTSLVGIDIETYLGHAGIFLGAEEGAMPGIEPACIDSMESQAMQTANWYIDFVNMVGWSELSPSNWPR